MEANVKETRAEWPADAMASLIFPNGLRKIYGTLKDPKGQDAVMAWIGRYILTGEDRPNYKVEEYLKILLKDEVARIFKRQRTNAEKGARGGRPPKASQKPTESRTKAEAKPAESQTDASGKPTESQAKADGKQREREREREIVGGKPPTTPTLFPLACACESGEAGGGEEDLSEFPEYAPVVDRIKALGLPKGLHLRFLFEKAKAFNLQPNDLLECLGHYQGRGWELPTKEGNKTKYVGPHTIAGALLGWSQKIHKFAKQGGTHGSAGNRNDNRGNGLRTDAAAYVEDPFA